MPPTMFKRTVAFAAYVATLLVAGCAFLGNHAAPQTTRIDPESLDVGSAIRAADKDAQWPDTDWWRIYHDPQLDTWIMAALNGSPTLEDANARVREAQAIARATDAALYPQLNGDLSIQRKHWPRNSYYGPGAFNNAEAWNNTGTLGFSYHLDLWGRDKNSALQALDTAHALASEARAAQLEIEVNIVRTYVQLSSDFALLDIEQETLGRQQKIESLAGRRLDAGLGTQLDVSEAQTPLPETERRISAIQARISLGRNQMAALAGKGPGAGEKITRPKLDLGASWSLPTVLPAELIGHRPDVVAARWQVAAAARGIDVSKADFYPNIDLLATLGGFAAGGPVGLFLDAANGGWTAGPALSLPILDGGRLRAQLGASSARYDEAVARYNETIVTALNEISDQVIRLRSLEIEEKEAQRYLQTTQNSYRLSEQAFRRGLTDYVNVLVAQTRLLDAQQEIVSIHAQQLIAHASLDAALGGGLAEPADGPKAAETVPSDISLIGRKHNAESAGVRP